MKFVSQMTASADPIWFQSWLNKLGTDNFRFCKLNIDVENLPFADSFKETMGLPHFSVCLPQVPPNLLVSFGTSTTEVEMFKNQAIAATLQYCWTAFVGRWSLVPHARDLAL